VPNRRRLSGTYFPATHTQQPRCSPARECLLPPPQPLAPGQQMVETHAVPWQPFFPGRKTPQREPQTATTLAMSGPRGDTSLLVLARVDVAAVAEPSANQGRRA